MLRWKKICCSHKLTNANNLVTDAILFGSVLKNWVLLSVYPSSDTTLLTVVIGVFVLPSSMGIHREAQAAFLVHVYMGVRSVYLQVKKWSM